jgi:hypothetical protein
MENTSKQTKQIPRRELAYYRRRNQIRQFAALAAFFNEEAQQGHITRKEIAEKLDKDPSQITRWFSAPSNFESDTISDLLLSMGAEMDHRIVRFSERAKSNYVHPFMVSVYSAQPTATITYTTTATTSVMAPSASMTITTQFNVTSTANSFVVLDSV